MVIAVRTHCNPLDRYANILEYTFSLCIELLIRNTDSSGERETWDFKVILACASLNEKQMPTFAYRDFALYLNVGKSHVTRTSKLYWSLFTYKGTL